MSRARIICGAVSLVGACLVIAAPAPSAGTAKAKTEIAYKNKVTMTMFIHSGRVSSESPKCAKNRTVELYGETFPKPFSTTETDEDGRYRFTSETDGIAQDYYTRVTKAEKPSVICKAAESEHKPLN